MRLGKEILTINTKNLFTIGTVGMAPKCIIVNKSLRNIPKEGKFTWDYRFFLPYQGDQWFFKR